MELVPVDPSSQVYKDLMAVNQANQQPSVAGTKQLLPVDPSAPEYKAIMAGADIKAPQRPGAPSSTQIDQAQTALRGDKARPMGGTPDINIDFKTGKASLTPPNLPQNQGSYAPAATLLSGGLGRVAQAIIGGGSAAIEGGSPTDIVIGALAPGTGEVGGKFVKAWLRGSSKFMSPAAMREAGSAIQNEAKAITTPVVAPTATRAVLEDIGSSVRTPDAAKAALVEHVDKLASRYAAGKPFDYGDFFEHANQISQKAAAAFESKAGQRTGAVLRKVQNAMMDDLAQIGPEAKIATDAWKKATSGVGGWSGAKKLWTAVSSLGIPGVSAVVAPATGAVGGAGAVITALSGLMVRAPGVGQSLARSLITPDGTVVKEALPALAQLITSNVRKGNQNGND